MQVKRWTAGAPELVKGVAVDVEAHHSIRHRVHPHQRRQQVLLRRARACR